MNNLNLIYNFGIISYQKNFSYTYDNEANVLEITLPNYVNEGSNAEQFTNMINAEVLTEVQMQQLDGNKTVFVQTVFKAIQSANAQIVETDIVITINITA